MRKLSVIILLLISCVSFGQVSLNGTHYILPNTKGVDSVIIFLDTKDSYITYTGADFESWKTFDGTELQSGAGAETIYVNDTTGYLLFAGGVQKGAYYVLDYSQHKVNLIDLQIDYDYDNRCSETQLILTADIEPLIYKNLYGIPTTVERHCAVSYTSLTWLSEWQDSVAIDTVRLYDAKATKHEYIIVGAPLKDTPFRLSVDHIATALGLVPDTISTDIYKACAVEAHPTTVTTVRGTEVENLRPNEVERPIEDTQVKGSAPLEILFKANANTPVAQYYKWQILKGSDLIVERSGDEHRYVFDDAGEYRVLLWTSSELCSSDSVEIQVSVSNSLLRVPNVFTPNGDGKNDEFRVMYRSIVEFECWVYNRWGHLVYHWTDPAKGWDGTINGRPAAEGAYYYIIRAKGADAEAGAKYRRSTKKNPLPVGVYQLSGDINLIRGKK